jgi:aspartate aminotransferase
MQVSQRILQIEESATLRLNALVQTLKAKGVPVINLTAGEPDFKVDPSVKNAAIAAIENDCSKYTAVAGILELRKKIIEKTLLQQPLLKSPWTPENVLVCNGAKHGLFNAMFTVLNPGDEVLIPSPYWLSYPEMVKIAEGVPVILRTKFEDGFKMTPAQLHAAITSKTRALILNSPSNPTGAVYSKKEFEDFGEVIRKHPNGKNIWIISDEIYDTIHFGNPVFCSFLAACPDLQEQTITVNGLSKSASLTRWRVGWIVAPRDVIAGAARLQGQCSSNINSVAKWASVAALSLTASVFEKQTEIYRKRRDLSFDILKKSGKIKVCAPQGAFYFFIGVKECLNPGENADHFAERLLEKANVAVVPGGSFGEPDYVRMSFALDEKSLREGCQRWIDFLG